METYEIKPHEMAGILRRLTERDIMLITTNSDIATLVFKDFRELADEDEKLRNAIFFDKSSFSIKLRSAPGVVHELRIRPSSFGRNGPAGYRGDVVIHSYRQEDRAEFTKRYSAVWLHHYIKECSNNGD